ncbi:MAG: nucleotidyltransferase domain-containing protein [Candidatus Pacearchaeota archaeon]|nr:MAG: nucleotidyltransferase domain-containing protein [Candidatus Pacearchaeota archaeon]
MKKKTEKNKEGKKYEMEKIGDIEKQIPKEVKKEIERIRDNLKDFKKALIKKFPYISAIGILPPPAAKIIEEEEEVEKEKDERIIHVVIIVPEEKSKEVGKIKVEGIRLIQGMKPRVWLHIKNIKQVWETCFDGKYALIEAIAMSFPLCDKGILGALRASSIHKTLVLKKFEKYVVSYVLAGSLVRGDATKTSDVDIFVVIDDTDVKRMSRYELKEKLRAIIYSYTMEASEIAGVENKLNPQIYILTEFWEAVKDAHPVIFTFIRDGVPLYDRGAFMPWKLLLKMGKIKPSPEAIDMFMSLGERVAKNVQRKLNDIVTEDIYWGIITPSQAALMLYGLAPPVPKEAVKLMRRVFVEKEKLLEPKYINILEKIIDIYKKYEHEEIKTISGREIDILLKQSSEYIKRLKELMKQIEKKAGEIEILQIYDTTLKLMKGILGKGGEAAIVKKFENELIKKSKLSPRNLIYLKEIIDAKKKYKKGKITKQDLSEVRKASYQLTLALTEYSQRRELLEAEKHRIILIYKTNEERKEVRKKGEIFLFKDITFIIPDITLDGIKKFKDGKVTDATKEELRKATAKKEKIEKRISPELVDALRKIFGKFELIF